MLKLQEIDQLDAKIIEELRRDARAKVSAIASRLKVPQATVRLRIAQLEKSKVIRGYAPILDSAKLGMPLKVVITLKISGSFSQDKTSEKILRIPDIVGLYGLSGDTDGMLVLRGRDLADINRKIMMLRAIPEIVSSNTQFILRSLVDESQTF